MVHQINDKSVPQLTGLPQVTGASARAQATTPEPTPAVRLEIREMAATGKTPLTPEAQAMPSSSLVQEIRERVESGRFVIDYESLGQALIREVVARATGRQG
jgi:anti-sigma28 factor (negative regulator of flagellin synthesis)